MLITAEIEKEINATLAGIFEEIEHEIEDVLFEAKRKLKDAYNAAVITSIIGITSICFGLLLLI